MPIFPVEIWGTVAQWASAVLTSGSLALGFYILLRDRRKEEKAQASLVAVWPNAWTNDAYVTTVHNASDRTVIEVTLYARRRLPSHLSTPTDETIWEGFPGTLVLKPDAEATFETPRSHDAKWIPEFVKFQDADGNLWVRHVDTGKLSRVRQSLNHRDLDKLYAPKKPLFSRRSGT